MKIVAAVLMTVVLVHGACMSRCLGEENARAATPPCHHHQGTPKHETSSSCVEGFALEANASPVLKCSLDAVSMPCETIIVTSSLSVSYFGNVPLYVDAISPPLLRPTVLRI